jgi:hypothetical protein
VQNNVDFSASWTSAYTCTAGGVALLVQMGTSRRMPPFPHVHGRNLEGVGLTLPDQLEGDLNCIVVAFQQWQQRLVDSWLPHLASLAAAHPGFCYYEMPTISRRWAPVRGFIDGGMARAITDRATRERTITVYTDVGAVVTALGLAGTETISTVLVDRRGEVVWQSTGAYADATSESLLAAIAELADR